MTTLDVTQPDVEKLFQQFNVGRNYMGFHTTILCLLRACEDDTRLFALYKEIYQPVSEATGIPCNRIERNLRTIIEKTWQNNPQLLAEIFGFPLGAPPSVGQFLDNVSTYLRRRSLNTTH